MQLRFRSHPPSAGALAGPRGLPGLVAEVRAAIDRLWTRGIAPPQQRLALAPLVARCLQQFEPEFERRAVHVRSELPQGLPCVDADAQAVEQVLVILITGALDAVAPGGHITLSTSHAAGRGLLALAVQDDGPGLSAAQLARANRACGLRDADTRLSMARRLLARHGGLLSVDSERGSGTVVSMSLKTAR